MVKLLNLRSDFEKLKEQIQVYLAFLQTYYSIVKLILKSYDIFDW